MAAKDDMHFVYEQARRFVSARPWERLGQASLYLDIKVGSWHEVCAQHFTNSSASALFLFPGHQNLLDMQRRGLGEPPAGTIFVELLDDHVSPEALAKLREHGWPSDLRPMPFFKTITPHGWQPLERNQIRILALALAAITDFDLARDIGPDDEVAGELTMPEDTRGRYRARRAPADDDDGMVPLMGMLRRDLYGDADCALTFTTISWPDYWALRDRAPLCRYAKVPFEERGDVVPVVTISGPRNQATEIAQKLTAAEPLGVMFGETDDLLAAFLVGLKASYMLLQVQDEREELMLWRHATSASGGAHAIAVEDTDAGQEPGDPNTASVHAIFECTVKAH
jgi:hypothetical protein